MYTHFLTSLIKHQHTVYKQLHNFSAKALVQSKAKAFSCFSMDHSHIRLSNLDLCMFRNRVKTNCIIPPRYKG